MMDHDDQLTPEHQGAAWACPCAQPQPSLPAASTVPPVCRATLLAQTMLGLGDGAGWSRRVRRGALGLLMSCSSAVPAPASEGGGQEWAALEQGQLQLMLAGESPAPAPEQCVCVCAATAVPTDTLRRLMSGPATRTGAGTNGAHTDVHLVIVCRIVYHAQVREW